MDKEYLKKAAKTVEAMLPDNHGFVLLTFPFNQEDGRVTYTASCSREESIKILKAMLFHWGESENWMEHIK